MPIATVDLSQEEKYDLKSLPEGYVVLRRMSYGQKLTRMQQSSKMSILMKKGQKDMKGEMESLQLNAAFYDFRTCVVSHNLTDLSGNALNFTDPTTISTLDPRVGEEIATYIDKLNNFEEDEELGNLASASE